MAFEILTIVLVGFATAGAVLLAKRVLRLPLPAWALPMATAVGMIVFTVYLRQTWADRTAASLPATMTVLEAYPYDGLLEPWSVVVPRTAGLLVLDRTATMTHPEHPGVKLVTLHLIEEYTDTLTTRQFVDCASRRRAPAAAGLDTGGLPSEAAWQAGGEPRALYAAVCDGP